MKDIVQISEEQAKEMFNHISVGDYEILEQYSIMNLKKAGYIKQEEKPVFDELVGKRVIHKATKDKTIIYKKINDNYRTHFADTFLTKEELLEDFWIEVVNC